MTIRKRPLDAEQKLRNDAKEGKVSLRKFKREYPHGARSDYKAIQKLEKNIGATNKTVFEASEKSVEKAEKKTKTATAQAKQMLRTTPGQQDDLLCANQKWVEAFADLRSQWLVRSSHGSGGCGERMFDPSRVQPGVAGSRF